MAKRTGGSFCLSVSSTDKFGMVTALRNVNGSASVYESNSDCKTSVLFSLEAKTIRTDKMHVFAEKAGLFG